MKIEKAKVPLAELRVIIGKTQPEMAAMLGVSLPTVQSIESKRMRLSRKLALRASFETNVNAEWVCRRITSKTHPPIDRIGQHYTKDAFAKYRARSEELPTPEEIAQHALFNIGAYSARVAAILAASHRSEEYLLCRFKLAESLNELEKQFGIDRRLHNDLLSPLGTAGDTPATNVLSPIAKELIAKNFKSNTKSK